MSLLVKKERSHRSRESAKGLEQAGLPTVRTTTEWKPSHFFLPVLLIAFTMLFASGFRFFQAMQDHLALTDRHQRQSAALLEARKVRRQLETVARETYQLSIDGNRNAALIVERMKKAGFRFEREAE